MSVEIRPVRDEELPAYVNTLSTGFLERPNVDAIVTEVRKHWDLSRSWAAVEDGRICGTFRSWPTELTLPGLERVPASAIAAVSVLPTHRRRGILRQLVAAEHAAARARGEVVALLHASEYAIYGRFGYGPAVPEATWTLDARSADFRTAAPSRVELVTPSEETRDIARGVFERWRLTTPSEIRRRDFTWDHTLGLREEPWGERWKGFLALHRDPGGSVDGYTRYRAEEKWEERQPRNRLVVDELHALNDEAYAALWRYVAEIDLVASVKAERRSPSERLPWLLTNARAAAVSDVGDGMWARLLDIPRALEARRYERDGRLVLRVDDPELPEGRATLSLEVADGAATCRPTDDAPDLTLPVEALGAAYLGGAPLHRLAPPLGAREHRAGALREADGLFRTADLPWCSTFF